MKHKMQTQKTVVKHEILLTRGFTITNKEKAEISFGQRLLSIGVLAIFKNVNNESTENVIFVENSGTTWAQQTVIKSVNPAMNFDDVLICETTLQLPREIAESKNVTFKSVFVFVDNLDIYYYPCPSRVKGVSKETSFGGNAVYAENENDIDPYVCSIVYNDYNFLAAIPAYNSALEWDGPKPESELLFSVAKAKDLHADIVTFLNLMPVDMVIEAGSNGTMSTDLWNGETEVSAKVRTVVDGEKVTVVVTFANHKEGGANDVTFSPDETLDKVKLHDAYFNAIGENLDEEDEDEEEEEEEEESEPGETEDEAGEDMTQKSGEDVTPNFIFPDNETQEPE